MEQHDFLQGSQEWHQHRATHFNASDAPAMLGISPNKSRTQLLTELATGYVPEVDPATQRRFDDGHRFEALARPLAEQIIGRKLYPVVGSEGRYSASFDGLTMDEEINFEHKSLNDELRRVFANDEPLPELYTSQMEHQHMVSGARRTLFMASTWDENDNLIEEHHRWYEPDQEMRAKVIAGWKQFAEDLANYQHVEKAPEAVGIAPETLPALHVELTGKVVASNLAEYKKTAMAIIDAVNTDLQTDQDFANAEKAVKWCGEVEARLEGAKQHALSQTASIDELFRTMDEIKEYTRQTRLKLDKLVKARKEALRAEIVIGARDALAAHIASLNERIGKPYMNLVIADFAAAIKGMRSFDSMRDAVTTALANAKIAANEQADRIERNLRTLRERADGYQTLFHDTAQLVLKAPDDLAAVITARIAEHKEAEEKKIAAAKEQAIADERRRAEAEQAAKDKAAAEEAERIRQFNEQQVAAAQQADNEERARLEAEKAKMESEQPSQAIQAEAQQAAQPKAPAESTKSDGATIKLGDIAARLGFTLTADFIEQTLGIAPAGRQRAAVLFYENDWPRICSGLVAHIQGVRAADHKREAA